MAALAHGRLLLLAIAGSSMALGFAGGLTRLGWGGTSGVALAGMHGPLMICGVFGTLIGIERAVALNRSWPWVVPALAAAGATLVAFGAPAALAAAVLTAAGAAYAAVTAGILAEDPGLPTAAMLMAALAWLAGAAAWFASGVTAEGTGWWLMFLILTIAGERLEMSRLVRRSRAGDVVFLAGIGLMAAGSWMTVPESDGAGLFGSGLILLVFALVGRDIARVNIRRSGELRYFSACMLAGYGWLAVAATLLASAPWLELPARYDASIHAAMLGFVGSMVFGHALIILPAVLGVRLRYAPVLYAPLALLHIAVLLRVCGGVASIEAARMASGPVAVAAFASFALCLIRTGRFPSRPRSGTARG